MKPIERRSIFAPASTMVCVLLTLTSYYIYYWNLSFFEAYKLDYLVVSLWPLNWIHYESVLRSDHAESEKTLFFLMNSTASAVWFFWLILNSIVSANSKELYTFPRIWIGALILMVLALMNLISDFNRAPGIRIMSVNGSIYKLIFYNSFFISILYVSFGVAIRSLIASLKIK